MDSNVPGRRRLLVSRFVGKPLVGAEATSFIHRLFENASPLPSFDVATRPLFLLSAMPRHVFPFEERAARLARYMGMELWRAKHVLHCYAKHRRAWPYSVTHSNNYLLR